jgi:large subunit ribosomal protein L9
MKVLLLEDIYKLGRAGEVKKVAPGYARNYLMPQGLAVLATPGAMKMADRIKKEGEVKRAKVNQELGGVAEQLAGKRFAEKVSEDIGVTVEAKQIESQPLRMLGKHNVSVRLTVDLIPEIEIIVHREGETPESALEEEEQEALRAAEALEEILEEEAADLDTEFEEPSEEIEQTEAAALPEDTEEETEEED